MADSGQHDWHSLDQRQVLELLDADSRYQRPMVPLFSSQSTMPIALLMFAQVVFLLLRKWISGHSAQLSRPTIAYQSIAVTAGPDPGGPLRPKTRPTVHIAERPVPDPHPAIRPP